jgi:Ca-activated chloride channel homolog
MLEYTNSHAWILGFAAILLWSVGYYRFYKRPELYIPKRASVKRMLLSRLIAWGIGVIGIAYISYSLMGPRQPYGIEESYVEISDIYLVFDVSRSMLAEDFPPNRLEAAKEIMLDYVNLKPTARLGIVMFSEKVFTLLPITFDHELVKAAIKEIDIGFLGSGTNIGDGLALAVGRLAQSNARSRIIILLTDGVNNVGSMTPNQAAEIAKSHGVKIYAIGMGGDEDARIPLPGNYLGRRRYQTIPGGSIDEDNLREISSMTGGRHWMAKEAESLRGVFQEIERLERSAVQTDGRVVYKELYYKYLFIGVILLLLSEIMRRYLLREEP